MKVVRFLETSSSTESKGKDIRRVVLAGSKGQASTGTARRGELCDTDMWNVILYFKQAVIGSTPIIATL